jgi:plasmid stabilization system protein ParE
MKVRFTQRARHHLRSIFQHVRASDPDAASALVDRIVGLTDELSAHPHLGRPVGSGTRRILTLPGAPYRIVYSLVGDEVRVLMIRHTSRRPLRDLT